MVHAANVVINYTQLTQRSKHRL